MNDEVDGFQPVVQPAAVVLTLLALSDVSHLQKLVILFLFENFNFVPSHLLGFDSFQLHSSHLFVILEVLDFSVQVQDEVTVLVHSVSVHFHEATLHDWFVWLDTEQLVLHLGFGL